jgi:hypothetical protein
MKLFIPFLTAIIVSLSAFLPEKVKMIKAYSIKSLDTIDGYFLIRNYDKSIYFIPSRYLSNFEFETADDVIDKGYYFGCRCDTSYRMSFNFNTPPLVLPIEGLARTYGYSKMLDDSLIYINHTSIVGRHTHERIKERYFVLNTNSFDFEFTSVGDSLAYFYYD